MDTLSANNLDMALLMEKGKLVDWLLLMVELQGLLHQ